MTTYAVSDLHGCKVFYDAIKAVIKPEDIVYCLGDAGDRGPQPWETLKVCLDDPQFIYIRGNHDEMLLEVMRDALFQDRGPWKTYSNLQILAYNGGYETYEGWMEEDEYNQRKYYDKLSATPLTALYGNKDNKGIYLCHAGGTPGIPEQWEKDEVLWSRDHFEDEWPEGRENDYVVHGHTPVSNFRDKDDENLFDVYRYAGGHKINIDTGAKWSGRACLFNLDTMDAIYLEL